MRPDEHKRKQSNQYKKKHGLEKKCSDTAKGSNAHTNTTSKPTLNNWDRYEEPIEDAGNQESDLLGRDFNTILNAGTGLSSFMKLQNEKEWDKQEDFDDLLTIDCKALADSLQTLSFFERLGFNEKDFDPSLINWLDENNELHDDLEPEKIVFIDQKSFDFSQPKSVEKSNINTLKTEEGINDTLDCDLLNTLVKNELEFVNEEPNISNSVNKKSTKEELQGKNSLTAEIEPNKDNKNDDLLKTNEENPVEELEDWLDSVL